MKQNLRNGLRVHRVPDWFADNLIENLLELRDRHRAGDCAAVEEFMEHYCLDKEPSPKPEVK